MKPVLNGSRMLRHSHTHPGFDKVLHVAHHDWHGIRNACAFAPGHKLLIPAHDPIDAPDTEANSTKSRIARQIEAEGITRVVFQGYSENADALLTFLRAAMGDEVRFFNITHVTTAQFENHFETEMIARLMQRLRFGVLDGIASVKPGFGEAFPDFWSGTILNFAPNVPAGLFPKNTERREVFLPLDADWRKNLYTNIMAATLARNVDVIKTANPPSGLDRVADLSKMQLVGYLRGDTLLAEMGRAQLVLLATLAECQPMTQLEAFAVGTPALTRRLNLPEFENDPLIALCETDALDNPALLRSDVERLVDAATSDPAAMQGMIADHLTRRHALAAQSYADFLRL